MKLVFSVVLLVSNLIYLEACPTVPIRYLATSDRRQLWCMDCDVGTVPWNHIYMQIYKNDDRGRRIVKWICEEMHRSHPNYTEQVEYPPKPVTFDYQLSFSYRVLDEIGQTFNCFDGRDHVDDFNGFFPVSLHHKWYSCVNAKNRRAFH